MALRIPQLQRFFYSHYFFGGLRQAIGVLLPAILMGGLFNRYDIGMTAALGALCVAIIDQPGGPRRYRTNEMLGGIVLGSLTVAITGMASLNPLLIWLIVPLLCFALSILTVFGKRGGLIGFACLLLMTLTMHTPLQPQQVLGHTLYSMLGGVFYFIFSFCLSSVLWYRIEQQALSVALFATADYMAARSRFYDVATDLDANYRQLIRTQADMTDKHQAARDMVLRELPKGHGRGDHHRVTLLNIFVDMIDLLDNLVATHTDYATLRQRLPDSDIMLFCRDALYKLSISIGRVALNIARNKQVKERSSVKAELRAIEYELEHFRRQGLDTHEPEVYALLVQVLRRLRNAAKSIDRMAEQTQRGTTEASVNLRLNKSLLPFLSRQELRFGMLTSNFRLSSPHFRYALRVAIAVIAGMGLTAVLGLFMTQEGMTVTLAGHSYWIILTILIVMKPGFALTRQRNGWRLTGTLIGCALAFVLFNLTHNLGIYFAVLVVAYVLGSSLVQLNYTVSAIFNTLFVLLAFHFLSPGTNFVIGERAVDTVIGCGLALLCSYILPWWERSYMDPLARAAKAANQEFLKSGLHYAALRRTQLGQGLLPAAPQAKQDAELEEADFALRLARKNVHITFGNFAAAFYRMMGEPVSHQKDVPELNNLLIQNHVLASQISAAVPILATLPVVPDGVQKMLDAISQLLSDQDATPPASIETEGELATLAYPLKQMAKAAQLIRKEMRGLENVRAVPAKT
ncbi:FUSC family protein [Paralcaligenes ureilyticus]|uniref:Putative membrane protein YccC n=1 Tax=Paralcaligenes ureilyticus TaxID=627131 RepID=A0A4R3LTA6_9BURK|nr:FUSC family protein [Paralcaligenes ureilyticus]TCT03780.1 putative membrane protein YccC [Paralcaligenes ureilyticus]